MIGLFKQIKFCQITYNNNNMGEKCRVSLGLNTNGDEIFKNKVFHTNNLQKAKERYVKKNITEKTKNRLNFALNLINYSNNIDVNSIFNQKTYEAKGSHIKTDAMDNHTTMTISEMEKSIKQKEYNIKILKKVGNKIKKIGIYIKNNPIEIALLFIPPVSLALKGTAIMGKLAISGFKLKNNTSKIVEGYKIIKNKYGKIIVRKIKKTAEKMPILKKMGIIEGLKIGKFFVKKIKTSGGDSVMYKLCDNKFNFIESGKTNFITFHLNGGKVSFSGMRVSGEANGLGKIFFEKILELYKGKTIYTTKQIKPSVNLMLERLGFVPIGKTKDIIYFNKTEIFIPENARKGLLNELKAKKHLKGYTISQLKKGASTKSYYKTYYNVKYMKKN